MLAATKFHAISYTIYKEADKGKSIAISLINSFFLVHYGV